MSEHDEQRFIARIEAGYRPPPTLGADLERRLLAQIERKPSPWRFVAPGAALAAVAVALLLWARPAPAPAVDPTEVASEVLALESGTELENEPLPEEYALLSDIWDEEMEL